MFSQTYKRQQDIITIESDDDDIQELDSPMTSNNQTFSNAIHYNRSITVAEIKKSTCSPQYITIPRLSTSNGLFNNNRHTEIVGTATAAIFNEKPLNIFDLSPMDQLKTTLSGLIHNQNHNNLTTHPALPSSSPIQQMTLKTANGKKPPPNRLQTFNTANIQIDENNGILHTSNKDNGVHPSRFNLTAKDTTPNFKPIAYKRIRDSTTSDSSNETIKVSRKDNRYPSQVSKTRQFTDFYSEASFIQNLSNDDEFHGQFKCTYNGCSKIIRNNISFMYHLWAHVVRFKPQIMEECLTNLQISAIKPSSEATSTDVVQKDDLTRLYTCPECLMVLENLHHMHLHYNRVHKFDKTFDEYHSVCIVCERIDENIQNHIIKHMDNDLPYSCRKCKYKTSYREALIRHFIRSHADTCTVLCPFCLLTFNILIHDRNQFRVVMRSFVQHMMDHENDYQQGCNQCATKFSKTRGATAIEGHSKQHKELDSRWKIVKKNISNFNNQQPHSVPVHKLPFPPYCSECLHVLDNSKNYQKHYKETMRCRTRNCQYETNCRKAMEFHTVLSLCRPENKNRWLYGEPVKKQRVNSNRKNLNGADDDEPLDMKCSKCDFRTQDGDLMAAHLAPGHECFGVNALIIRKNEDEVEEKLNNDMEEWSQIEEEMVELFGLNRLANIDPVKLEEERKREKVLKRELLRNPPPKAETSCSTSANSGKIGTRNSSSKSRSPPLKLTEEEILKGGQFKEIEKELEQMIPPVKIPFAMENPKLISLLLPEQIEMQRQKSKDEFETIALSLSCLPTNSDTTNNLKEYIERFKRVQPEVNEL